MVVLAAYDRIRQVEVKCEVPRGAAEGYVFSWEGVATQAATTRCPSRFVPPPRSGGGSSELVRMLAIRNLSVLTSLHLPLCRVYKQLLKDSADYKDVAEGWKDLLQTTATNRSVIMLWATGNSCLTPLSTAAGTESLSREQRRQPLL